MCNKTTDYILKLNRWVNKIALSANDDKRLQTYDRIKTYLYGANAFKACESEMLNSKRFVLWNMYKLWWSCWWK